MHDYAGPTASDPTTGSHGYLGDHLDDVEAFNFAANSMASLHDHCLPANPERVDINRLGTASIIQPSTPTIADQREWRPCVRGGPCITACVR